MTWTCTKRQLRKFTRNFCMSKQILLSSSSIPVFWKIDQDISSHLKKWTKWFHFQHFNPIQNPSIYQPTFNFFVRIILGTQFSSFLWIRSRQGIFIFQLRLFARISIFYPPIFCLFSVEYNSVLTSFLHKLDVNVELLTIARSGGRLWVLWCDVGMPKKLRYTCQSLIPAVSCRGD